VSSARAAPLAGAGLAAASLVAPVTHAQAQALYVIEQLVVNLNSAPDAGGERVATLKSGDRVELIERAGESAHVRLESGRDGWVRSSYLSAEEPLTVRLAQREQQLAQLQEELSRARAQLAAPTPAAGTAARAAGAAPLAAGAQDAGNAAPFAVPGEAHTLRLWPWALGCALIGFAAGVMLGALMLDRYIRSKYGGLRIY
jgi:uncharacterized protein YciI